MKLKVDAYNTQKNKAVTKPIFLYEIQYDSVGNQWLRYTNWTTDVVFDGQTYTKYAITHDNISESLDGSAVKVKLKIGNVNRTIQYYLENWNGLRDAKVNILQVFFDELSTPSAVDLLTFFIADSAVDARDATFVLSSKFDVFDITLPRRKFYRSYCSHKFKDAGCAYSGVETTCNKSMQRCKELGNIHRYGAFPAIPQRNVYKVNVSEN